MAEEVSSELEYQIFCGSKTCMYNVYVYIYIYIHMYIYIYTYLIKKN